MNDLNQSLAYFSGGCFWCTKNDFEEVKGVIEVKSGYSGGNDENPNYEKVSQKLSDHRESIQVVYDKSVISFEELVKWFLRHIDPTDSNGQFYDRGENYAPCIYFQSNEEKTIANSLLNELNNSNIFDKKIEVKVEDFKSFMRQSHIIRHIRKIITLDTAITGKVLEEINF
jgi:peptide methionine sulfoxide reductase msrA/msrB